MKLTATEINEQLKTLNGWTLDGAAITKDFKFSDFKTAFGFMTRVAAEAERLNHHPDWCNVYNKVTVTLSSHEVGGLTAIDFELGAKMDRLATEQ